VDAIPLGWPWASAVTAASDARAAPPAGEVEAARAGDRAAFGRLFRRYAPLVHGVLLARVRPAEADDLMQDVFLAALEKLPALRDEGAFGAWICSIARNRVTDHHRGKRPMDELPEDLGRPDADRSEAEAVLRAIQALPEAYREPLVLRLVEGLSGPEIADQVGLTADSVRVNLHRGMKLLREKLGTDHE
jgi:RNA polymerase sigma-70 factor, ECF subfamily